MRVVVLVAVLLGGVLTAQDSVAAPLKVYFSGTVRDWPARPGILLGTDAHPGSSFHGSLTLETSTPDGEAEDPAWGVYSGAVTSFSMAFDGVPWVIDYPQPAWNGYYRSGGDIVVESPSATSTYYHWRVGLGMESDDVYFPRIVPLGQFDYVSSVGNPMTFALGTDYVSLDAGMGTDGIVPSASVDLADWYLIVGCCDGYAGFWELESLVVPEPQTPGLVLTVVAVLAGVFALRPGMMMVRRLIPWVLCED